MGERERERTGKEEFSNTIHALSLTCNENTGCI